MRGDGYAFQDQIRLMFVNSRSPEALSSINQILDQISTIDSKLEGDIIDNMIKTLKVGEKFLDRFQSHGATADQLRNMAERLNLDLTQVTLEAVLIARGQRLASPTKSSRHRPPPEVPPAQLPP